MGEQPSFDEFVVTRSAHLLRTAYLLTHDWSLAEDLLQTTLAKAWSAWPRMSDEPEPYVRRILVNAYASGWRRKWRGEIPHAGLPEVETASHADALVERDLLWQALGRLPRRQRAVLVLRYFEDLPETQVADLLGVSVGTVKSQTSKAFGHLRVDETLRQPVDERS